MEHESPLCGNEFQNQNLIKYPRLLQAFSTENNLEIEMFENVHHNNLHRLCCTLDCFRHLDSNDSNEESQPPINTEIFLSVKQSNYCKLHPRNYESGGLASNKAETWPPPFASSPSLLLVRLPPIIRSPLPRLF